MNMLRILFFIMVFCVNSLSAQDYTQYYSYCNKAYIYYASKDYKQAASTYEKAFKVNFPFPDDVILATKCYLAMEDNRNALKMLKVLIKSGYNTISETAIYTTSSPKQFPALINIENENVNEKFSKKYPKWRKQYLKQVDFGKDKYLESVKIIESFIQILRKNYDTEASTIFQDSGFYQASRLLINLLKYNNEIDRNKTDNWGDMTFLTALIHTALTLKNAELDDYFLLLRKQVLKGNLHPMQYAELYDGVLSRNGFSVKYGQQLERKYDEEGQYIKKLRPIQDMMQIDSIRSEIFLPPLWAYCLVQNIALPENYVHPTIK